MGLSCSGSSAWCQSSEWRLKSLVSPSRDRRLILAAASRALLSSSSFLARLCEEARLSESTEEEDEDEEEDEEEEDEELEPESESEELELSDWVSLRFLAFLRGLALSCRLSSPWYGSFERRSAPALIPLAATSSS